MKILIFSHSFYPAIGGIESISEILAENFVKAGHEVHLLTWTKECGEKTFSYPITRNPKLIDLFKCIAWADVLFENNPCFQLSWPNSLLNKPKVSGLQTWIGTNGNQLNFKEKIKRKGLALSTKLIACSTAIKDKTADQAIVIPNPYDSEKFRIKAEIIKSKDFLFLGRLVSDKGVGLAIKAFKLYHEQNTGEQSSLTIVGNGPEKDNLVQEVKNAGLEDHVEFLGSVQGEKLVDILNAHRFLLVPSIWDEPFGIVVLEGMACACVPIVSDGGGLPEATGNAGLTFIKGDVNDLYKCMLQVKQDKYLVQELQKAAITHLDKHQAAQVSKQYLAVLHSCLA